jgi:hypothetical protein
MDSLWNNMHKTVHELLILSLMESHIDYLQNSTQDLIHLNLNHTAITEKIIPFLKSKIIYIYIHDFG